MNTHLTATWSECTNKEQISLLPNSYFETITFWVYVCTQSVWWFWWCHSTRHRWMSHTFPYSTTSPSRSSTVFVQRRCFVRASVRRISAYFASDILRLRVSFITTCPVNLCAGISSMHGPRCANISMVRMYSRIRFYFDKSFLQRFVFCIVILMSKQNFFVCFIAATRTHLYFILLLVTKCWAFVLGEISLVCVFEI